MKYTINYYNDTVQQEVMNLPHGLAGRYVALTKRMIESGANLGEPHTQAISGGLFELRLKSHEGIVRVFYCTLVGKQIVILHSFIKKTQKTPAKELNLAQTRTKEVKNAYP
jgi:phage-related protein